MMRNFVTKPLEGMLSQATSQIGPMLGNLFGGRPVQQARPSLQS